MPSRSRRVSSAPFRSALLMTKMSAISIRPALFACTLSPQPGLTTTTVVSALPAISTSTCPTPTVSTRIHRRPTASSRRTASGVANDRPPRWPRVAMERMNTPGSVAWSCIRTRSPRIAPPVKGDDGSIASTATSICCLRMRPMTALVSVLLPAPGAPVRPTVYAPPACGEARRLTCRASSPPRSTNDSNLATAARSPDRAASNSSATGWFRRLMRR